MGHHSQCSNAYLHPTTLVLPSGIMPQAKRLVIFLQETGSTDTGIPFASCNEGARGQALQMCHDSVDQQSVKILLDSGPMSSL